jgi:type IV secretion system protein VirB5
MKPAIRRYGLCIALSMVCFDARAMPVFDAAAYAQAVQQIQAWKQQFQQMTLQLKQMQAQHDALTGSRGLGEIMNNPQLRNLVPADAVNAFNSLRAGGTGAMTAEAIRLRGASKIYDCENRSGTDLVTCQAFLNTSSQALAYQQNAMMRLNQRLQQVDGLQGQINMTNDPKSIAELSARLIAESAQIANDANRLAVLRSTADMADRASQQALKERELLMLSRHGDGSDTFVYKPYAGR